MKYWTFKHQPGQNQPEEQCKKFVEWAIKLNSALMQYEYDAQDKGKVTSNWNFIKNNLKEGDMLFLRGGERIYAVGKIVKPRIKADEVLNMTDIINRKSHDGYSSAKYDGCIHFNDCPIFYEDLSDGEGEWGQRIDVQAWKYYFPNGIYCKDQDNYVDGSNEFNVVKELKSDKAKGFIKQLKEKFMGPALELLKSNKNLILTGAPGTGKTFLARNLALKLITGKTDEKLLSAEEQTAFKNQYCFVQFHPSYDYTDFVEGLRPTPPDDANGQIGFELKNGVFKEFCERALKDTIADEVDNFEEAWNKLIQAAINDNEISVPLNTQKATRYVISKNLSLKFVDIDAGTLTKDNIYSVYKGLKGRASGAFQNYMQAVVDYMKNNYGLQPYQQGSPLSANTKNINDKKYVFVIDEINRGEISKIFGELFFSIDPGYRGEKGKVSTQYANMIPPGDVFKNGFYVPENVYIIGTMNDIDRSVESFDFAMRRRFVWQEITAEESAANMKLPHPAIDRIKRLNNCISSISGLNSSYHIGAAYFLKKEGETVVEPDYPSLWRLRLKPLLGEYLRGMPDAKERIAELHKAFDPTYTGASEE